MPDYVKAIAVDFEGTLTTVEPPEPACDCARRRTDSGAADCCSSPAAPWDHLPSGFADVDDSFDAIWPGVNPA